MCNRSAWRQWTETPTNCLLGFQYRIPLFSNSNLWVSHESKMRTNLPLQKQIQPLPATCQEALHSPQSQLVSAIHPPRRRTSNADLFKNTCVQLLKMNSDDAPLVIFSATTTYLFKTQANLGLERSAISMKTPWGKPIFYHYPTPDFVQLLGGLLKICLQILHLDLESLERQWRTNPQGLSITAAPMPTPWLANKSFVVIIIT